MFLISPPPHTHTIFDSKNYSIPFFPENSIPKSKFGFIQFNKIFIQLKNQGIKDQYTIPMRKSLSSGLKWFLRPYFPLISNMFLLRSGLWISIRALEFISSFTIMSLPNTRISSANSWNCQIFAREWGTGGWLGFIPKEWLFFALREQRQKFVSLLIIGLFLPFMVSCSLAHLEPELEVFEVWEFGSW